ncbi:gamma-glutamylcyclotransferase [uncultured Neptuniibacter sp.]|uniref:gamma-glutamylcyclotransferase n=1 Tax=uncultured Neptuniibacter sp. TaxID=502143 RepID=UPI00263093A6|nr:gamma-glutamylcyclotransferase [uncultured Neptuniibacter sp.]
MISVIGYGSLLSEASARETVPGLKNFRIVEVPGYKRIFNKVGIVFLSRYQADPASKTLASCSTLADEHSSIICSQFECTSDDYAALEEREHRFNWIQVDTRSSSGDISKGYMCTTSSDQYYRTRKCRTAEEYQSRVGQFYDGLIWRNDILPYPRYLSFCLQAAEALGEDVLDNFLDHSYLADGKTSIRTYLDTSELMKGWRQFDCGYRYSK